MRYYGPKHTYRYEVYCSLRPFYTDNRSEAIKVAKERAKAANRPAKIVDIDENTVMVYRPDGSSYTYFCL